MEYSRAGDLNLVEIVSTFGNVPTGTGLHNKMVDRWNCRKHFLPVKFGVFQT